MTLPRIAVLASGRGSNLQAILDAIAQGRLDARLVGVFSDRPQAGALMRVPPELRWSARPSSFESRQAYEQALGDARPPPAPTGSCAPAICASWARR